jgi:ankyrin repeat protein
LIDESHIKDHGEDLLLVACEAGNKDAVEFLIKKGVSISNPPEWTRSRYYRLTPYLL